MRRAFGGGGEKGFSVYIFDIKKNECWLIEWVSQRNGSVYMKDILSSAEYDKWCKHVVKYLVGMSYCSFS
ncbi:type II toxin-antitoxin system HigB family toxin [Pseudomonas sp. Marseille-P9899]|uniref:type II toxin-antitoxin system HigB family toxin n=1 Tax=Pseudomonas sp. Marseille-P9899 TaxID=2730401 RepID=UPI00158C42BC